MQLRHRHAPGARQGATRAPRGQVVLKAVAGGQRRWPGRSSPVVPSLHGGLPAGLSSSLSLSADGRQRGWHICSASEPGGGGGVSGGGGDGGDGKGGGGGSGGGGGGGDDEEDDEVLNPAELEAAAAAAKVQLPADMMDTARQVGLRSSAFSKYVALQGLGLAGTLARRFPAVRDRLIADDKFLFKVVAEIFIDAVCATVAEVRKRGDEFWAEFEFYLSDLTVGVVLDVALVSLIAPRAVLGAKPIAVQGSALTKWLSKIPSAVFEASVPGLRTYSVPARAACVVVKFLEYSLAGIACGLIGQGVANGLMLTKRHFQGAKEDDVAVPPLFRTALVWGLFMGVSSNLRYQVVFGLERLVDMTIARRVPQIAYGTTVGIRFVNNVIGGEQFVDLARWAGVQ